MGVIFFFFWGGGRLSAVFDMLLVNDLLAYPADRLIECGAAFPSLQCEKFVLEPSLNRNPDFTANLLRINMLSDDCTIFIALLLFSLSFTSLLLFLSFMFQPLITSSAL